RGTGSRHGRRLPARACRPRSGTERGASGVRPLPRGPSAPHPGVGRLSARGATSRAGRSRRGRSRPGAYRAGAGPDHGRVVHASRGGRRRAGGGTIASAGAPPREPAAASPARAAANRLRPPLAVKSHEVVHSQEAAHGRTTGETAMVAMPVVVVQPTDRRG